MRITSKNEKLPYEFSFDRVFDENSTQQEVFEVTAKPIINSKLLILLIIYLFYLGVLAGFNGTIFAYGQTSSGKTHTMQGVIGDEYLKGIIPRVVNYLYDYINQSNDDIEYTIKISMIEVYNEKLRVISLLINLGLT